MLPQFQAHMSTGDQWKAHRKLTGDLMSSTFLNNVLSETNSDAALDLVSLWKQKARLARKRPIDAKHDISCVSLDAIWCVCDTSYK